MKFNLAAIVPVLLLGLFITGCNQNNAGKKEPQDGFTTGTALFAVDESFSPIVDEELYVFKALWPQAKPTIAYRTEAQAVNMLLNDSTRVVVLSRELNSNEMAVIKKRTLSADVNKFAIDAVAIIVNQASNDTTITVGEIKKMLNGGAQTGKSIVFDNPNSSLVRYLKQLAGNIDFKQKNLYALKSSKEVIKYISEHQDAIGIVGFSWLNDPDEDYAAAVDKVKIVGVRDENNKKATNQYFKPSQESLVLKTYPLSRSLYIIDCTSRKGLGAGFASFLASERGQRIILKSGLLPDSIPGREINIVH